jgi:pilus assembly protein CpaC
MTRTRAKTIPETLLVAAILIGGLTVASRSVAGVGAVESPNAVVDVEVSKGLLVRLDAPVSNVFLADSKIADVQIKSPTMIYVIGKATGTTSLMAVDSNDRVVANLDVSVHYNETQLAQDFKRLIPGSDIKVGTINNALVLSGSIGSVAEGETAKEIAARYVPDADHLVNAMQTDAPYQVNLRVRVAEVSRQVIKAFGVNWGSSIGAGKFSFGLATGAGAPGIPSPLHLAGVDNIIAGFKSGAVDLNVVIDALESEGLINILAEPNLTAISGAPASFLAGGEYPIPVPQGLNQVTIEYKKFGVSLAFVATITDGGRINLLVKPEVSELSSNGAITLNGATVPALTTRRMETTVDLASGQSFAIAGLMQNNVTQNIHKFPGLGAMPVLGALFRSDSFQKNETELVVIVTPYIVRPVSSRHVAAPTDTARILKGADATPTRSSKEGISR